MSGIAKPQLAGNDKDLLQGIKVTVEELRQLRSDLWRMGNAPADVIHSLFPGAWRTKMRGRGLEFDEVRNYQWGDDYRTVDWRVTARTGVMHTKLFHEERERTLYLLLDAGPMMHFGSRVQYKWVLAARAAALFAWSAMEGGDRVGLVVYGAGPRVQVLPAATGEAAVVRLFQLLAAVESHQTPSGPSLNDALGRLRHLTHTGARLLLVSDFSSLTTDTRKHLSYLARYCHLAVIHAFDPLEQTLPMHGLYPVSDGRHITLLDADSPGLREAYAQRFTEHCDAVKSLFRRYAAPVIQLATHEPLIERLRQELRLLSFGRPAGVRRLATTRSGTA